jgi:hypothetical protein
MLRTGAHAYTGKAPKDPQEAMQVRLAAQAGHASMLAHTAACMQLSLCPLVAQQQQQQQ